jgi:hypothetical protein
MATVQASFLEISRSRLLERNASLINNRNLIQVVTLTLLPLATLYSPRSISNILVKTAH